MGRNDDLDARTAQARFENEVGPRRDFGHYARCPACRSLALKRGFCNQTALGGPTTRDGSPRCPIEGRHLHVLCECAWNGLERTADDPENEGPQETGLWEMPEAPDVLVALCQMAGGAVTIPADVLERVQVSEAKLEVQRLSFGARLVVRG